MTGYKVDLKQVCGCQIAIEAWSKDDLVGTVVGHAQQKHKIVEVPPELANKLNVAIREI